MHLAAPTARFMHRAPPLRLAVVDYLLVKFAHVLVAIVAIGSSAGLGILLELYGDDPAHGAYLLRAIRAIERALVLPGYALMLATGLWMVTLSWSLRVPWLQASLALWALGVLLLGAYLPMLDRQIRLAESGLHASLAYRRLSIAGRLVGGGAGLVVAVIAFLMVTKPALAWWPS